MNTYVKAGLIVMLIGVLVFAGFAVAAVIKQYVYPSSATVNKLEVTIYLNGEVWTNGTAIPWGNVNASTTYYYDNLTAKNTGEVAVTVTLHAEGLPAGWTTEWIGNDTFLEVNESVGGELSLSVPAEATDGFHSWNYIVVVEQT